eukprot:TRINITY_DN2741_c0_g1_i1.p1 TRINITY_DN2741_c0_g1~~TRINITY_DN2741_c0_g1_i1.p1  ORF type:complete len:609 (-),score=160.88 TRINITY_DN2741_c0_g1_i1:41-1867(-)
MIHNQGDAVARGEFWGRSHNKEETPTKIWKAADKGDTSKVQSYIKKGEYPVNALGPDKKTPLHYAARKGHLQTCQSLIALQADVNAFDMGHNTPVLCALVAGQEEVALFLASCGADLSLTNNKQLNGLIVVAKNGRLLDSMKKVAYVNFPKAEHPNYKAPPPDPVVNLPPYKCVSLTETVLSVAQIMLSFGYSCPDPVLPQKNPLSTKNPAPLYPILSGTAISFPVILLIDRFKGAAIRLNAHASSFVGGPAGKAPNNVEGVKSSSASIAAKSKAITEAVKKADDNRKSAFLKAPPTAPSTRDDDSVQPKDIEILKSLSDELLSASYTTFSTWERCFCVSFSAQMEKVTLCLKDAIGPSDIAPSSCRVTLEYVKLYRYILGELLMSRNLQQEKQMGPQLHTLARALKSLMVAKATKNDAAKSGLLRGIVEALKKVRTCFESPPSPYVPGDKFTAIEVTECFEAANKVWTEMNWTTKDPAMSVNLRLTSAFTKLQEEFTVLRRLLTLEEASRETVFLILSSAMIVHCHCTAIVKYTLNSSAPAVQQEFIQGFAGFLSSSANQCVLSASSFAFSFSAPAKAHIGVSVRAIAYGVFLLLDHFYQSNIAALS